MLALAAIFRKLYAFSIAQKSGAYFLELSLRVARISSMKPVGRLSCVVEKMCLLLQGRNMQFEYSSIDDRHIYYYPLLQLSSSDSIIPSIPLSY